MAPLDRTGCPLLFRLVPAAYENPTGRELGRFLPDQPTTGDSYRLTHRTTGGHTTT